MLAELTSLVVKTKNTCFVAKEHLIYITTNPRKNPFLTKSLFNGFNPPVKLKLFEKVQKVY